MPQYLLHLEKKAIQLCGVRTLETDPSLIPSTAIYYMTLTEPIFQPLWATIFDIA